MIATLISQYLEHDINNGDDDTNSDTEIIEILESHGVMRRIELINQLKNKHPKETGYSLPTLNRRIAQLVKSEKIGIIKKDKFPIFGIDDSHENASYLMSQGRFEKKQHFDEVISDIPKGSKEEVYTALYEILLYKSNYRLTPKQLDQIISALRYDDKIIAIALQIIEETVIRHQIKPSNQKTFSTKLKAVLLKIRDNVENRTQIRQIVHILGFLMDDFVIDQLAHDAPLFDDNKITIEEYANGILIPIFEKNRSRLYTLEKDFIKQGNEKAAKRVLSIRDHLLNPSKYGIEKRGVDYMVILLLNGHGISMHVDGAKLHIKDGRTSTTEEPAQYIFSPQKIGVDNIVINGRSGNLSLDAIRWLVKHGVQITVLNWDGKILTVMLPPESVQVKTKFAQYRAFEDSTHRLEIAKQFIEGKFARTQFVLDYLNQRYPDVETALPQDSENLIEARSVKEVMGVEGAVAAFYWRQIQRVIPEDLEFSSRCVGRTNRPIGASDAVNCMLNYGYGLLEAECLRAINASGLDAHVGFLHEMAPGKYSLAYDMQELFRFVVDLAVLNIIEKGIIEKKDFMRTDNFTLKMRSSGTRKVTTELNTWLNKTVRYQERETSWNYLIFLKTRELAHYLNGKKKSLDLVSPDQQIDRPDSDEIRKKILAIPYSEWKKRGFSKGGLNYMKKNAENDKPFTLNKHVRERLDQWIRG